LRMQTDQEAVCVCMCACDGRLCVLVMMVLLIPLL
jgi:hypothetical protein